MLDYEYDERKAAINLRKHDVSFTEAVTIFLDPLALVLEDDEHSADEYRYIALGMSSAGRVLFVVYTERDSTVRMISARLATATERRQYENG